jgi:hypothetical protein
MQLVAYVAQDVYFTGNPETNPPFLYMRIRRVNRPSTSPHERMRRTRRGRGRHERMRQGPRKSENLCPIPQASPFIISAV